MFQETTLFDTLFDTLLNLIKNQDIDELKKLYESGVDPHQYLMEYAIEVNNIEIIQFLLDKGYTLTCNNMCLASSYGHLDIMKFFHSLNCPYNYDMASEASKFGHLESLKYAIEIGNKDIFKYSLYNATITGQLDIIRYLVEEKKEYVDLTIVELAANKGHLECLKYFHSIHAPFKKSVLNYAKSSRSKNKLKVIEYLSEVLGMNEEDHDCEYY